MASLGDVKACRVCGAEAILKRIPESTGGFVGEGGAIQQRIPAHYAWECSECGERVPLDGEIET
jgi:hypothetical protein